MRETVRKKLKDGHIQVTYYYHPRSFWDVLLGRGQIEDIMIMVENLSVKLHPENPITHNDYKVEEQTPHEWPKELPKGYCAVYFYAHNDSVLKIGKANEKSKSRYTSQHYRFNAPSTLAKSLYENSSRCEEDGST